MARTITDPIHIGLDPQAVSRASVTSDPQPFTLDHLPSKVPKSTLVAPWAGRLMIKDRFQDQWDKPNPELIICAVEFDKQTLLSILSQNGCEGIRFSHCNFDGGPTLVAFGIDSNNVLIGKDFFREDFQPVSPLNDPPPPPPPPGSEQGHKVTLAQFKRFVENKNGAPWASLPREKQIAIAVEEFINISTDTYRDLI